MGRWIDADKIIFREIDEIGGDYEPYLGCSKSQINSLPTVEAIPKDQYEARLKADMVAMLDKIRAEIMQLDYDLESVDFDYNDMALTEEIHTICREEVLRILDKYKAESEDKR